MEKVPSIRREVRSSALGGGGSNRQKDECDGKVWRERSTDAFVPTWEKGSTVHKIVTKHSGEKTKKHCRENSKKRKSKEKKEERGSITLRGENIRVLLPGTG